jgi:hypothetical protein
MQILDQNVPVCEAYNAGMALSARNRLKGTVEEVVLGTVMAHVVPEPSISRAGCS